MNTIFKILYLLIALEVVAVIFFVYRKRRLVKNDKKTSLPRLSKLAGLTIYKLAGLIKKHWITPVCIVSVCIALFALIYPTIWFVYIKFIIVKWWPCLLTLFPCLILLLRRVNLSLKIVLRIAVEYLLAFLLSFTLWTQFFSKHYESLLWYWSLIRNSTLSFLGLFLFLAPLYMFVFKKKEIRWQFCLIAMSIALAFVLGKAYLFRDVTFNPPKIYDLTISDLTNIRTEEKCNYANINSKQTTQTCSTSGNSYFGSRSCSWVGYYWTIGLCIKSMTSSTGHWIQ